MQPLYLVKLLEVVRPLERRLGLLLAESGFTVTQFRLLILLEGEPRSPSYCSSELAVSKPLVTSLLKELERCGVIETAGCTKDRRSIQVLLTETGAERLKIAKRSIAVLEANVGTTYLREMVETLAQLEKQRLQ